MLSQHQTFWLSVVLIALQGVTGIAWSSFGLDTHYVAGFASVIGWLQSILLFMLHGNITASGALANAAQAMGQTVTQATIAIKKNGVVILLALFPLAGCAQLDKQIATNSAALNAKCVQLQTIGQTVATLPVTPASANAVGIANTGLNTWCAAPPTDTVTAIASVVAIIAAVKQHQTAIAKGN
jgi:hypothetical protein